MAHLTSPWRRARRQQAVVDLGQDALQGGPVEILLQRIPVAVVDALGVVHCHVVRLEADGTRTMVSSSDRGGARPLFLDDRDCPVCVDALDRRDVVVWGRAREGSGRRRRQRDGFARAVAVPIVPATGAPGALAVCSRDPCGLGPGDVVFLQSVSRMLGAALSRRNMEDALRRQAVHDDLTGLPNRTLLQDRLATALSRLCRNGRCVSALFIDVDNFKLVNDSLGHTFGDSVVAAVATRLKDAVRTSDTVARFGGDEFVVVSECDDVTAARRLADRIRQAVAAPLVVAGRTISLTVSIGYATTADPSTSPDELLADADMAMYEAKGAGKNRSEAFVAPLRRKSAAHFETISGIRRGLDADEFRLFYQPICELATNCVAGYEALLRWQSPTSGLLLPEQFIDYAEASGLIVPLGKWVLTTGCRQAAAWRRTGQPARVSMNVSGRQLTDGGFVHDVAAALRETGADPADIHVEVTESVLISDQARARSALDALHDLGVHLGLDDFGTGWSSLSQLAFLPFDFVKIDRCFVHDVQTDQRASALLRSIVGLCTTLGLRVIVEGIETVSQLDYVRQLGVRMGQGFLLGRPVPAEAIGPDAGGPPVDRSACRGDGDRQAPTRERHAEDRGASARASAPPAGRLSVPVQEKAASARTATRRPVPTNVPSISTPTHAVTSSRASEGFMR